MLAAHMYSMHVVSAAMWVSNPLRARSCSCASLDLAKGKGSSACVYKICNDPRSQNSIPRRLDGKPPKSSSNQCGVHPGPPGETTGARAPSHAGGVQGDRPAGKPPGRAIGGLIHRTGKKFPEGGLNLPWLVLICLVLKLVDCRSTL